MGSWGRDRGRRDPCDTQWELDDPVHRVYFWTRPEPSADDSSASPMSVCDEHRLTGATGVGEAVDWAQRHVGSDRVFVLYVEHCDGGGRV